MGSASFPGVGKRIRERLLALGYVREDKEPDVGRFLKEKNYDGRYFYPWLKDRTPSPEFLGRLAFDLECSRAWLLLGEGPEPDDPKPRRRPIRTISGGSANDCALGRGDPLPVENAPGQGRGNMSGLITTFLYLWWPEPIPSTIYAYV